MENNEQIGVAFNRPRKSFVANNKSCKQPTESSLKQIDWSLENTLLLPSNNNSYVDQRQLVTTVAYKWGP